MQQQVCLSVSLMSRVNGSMRVLVLLASGDPLAIATFCYKDECYVFFIILGVAPQSSIEWIFLLKILALLGRGACFIQ